MMYLSGAITARFKFQEEKNRERFAKKAEELRSLGLQVFSPCEDEKKQSSWEEYLAKDLKWIFENKPSEFYFMKGWRKSRGARLEHAVAQTLDAKITYEV